MSRSITSSEVGVNVGRELAFLAARSRARARGRAGGAHHERITAPLFTLSALRAAPNDFPQRGLLGVGSDGYGSEEEPVYFNTNTPSSGVVCGVQGSGKSHTVSCLLENALLADDRIGNLSHPLAALVFHFDEEDCDRVCEAAYLGTLVSDTGETQAPQITVLASASNIANRRRAYAEIPNVVVEPLCLAEADVTAPRLLSLMGWSDDAERLPLYMHAVMAIVRGMGTEGFTYSAFRYQIAGCKFDVKQRMMLGHRLNLLDGFINPGARPISSYFTPGGMVLVDLTDPFLDGLMASILFDIALSSFMSWQCPTGRIVVLDEAHKYLSNNDSARLNRSVATVIRMQRHLATRVIIATQEPTVVPSTILDLASFIICHRFSSPSWCAHLSKHINSGDQGWYQEVMLLGTGDALLFAPTARVTDQALPLGTEALRISVRPRLTWDGGASVLAIRDEGALLDDTEPDTPSTHHSAAEVDWTSETTCSSAPLDEAAELPSKPVFMPLTPPDVATELPSEPSGGDATELWPVPSPTSPHRATEPSSEPDVKTEPPSEPSGAYVNEPSPVPSSTSLHRAAEPPSEPSGTYANAPSPVPSSTSLYRATGPPSESLGAYVNEPSPVPPHTSLYREIEASSGAWSASQDVAAQPSPVASSSALTDATQRPPRPSSAPPDDAHNLPSGSWSVSPGRATQPSSVPSSPPADSLLFATIQTNGPARPPPPLDALITMINTHPTTEDSDVRETVILVVSALHARATFHGVDSYFPVGMISDDIPERIRPTSDAFLMAVLVAGWVGVARRDGDGDAMTIQLVPSLSDSPIDSETDAQEQAPNLDEPAPVEDYLRLIVAWSGPARCPKSNATRLRELVRELHRRWVETGRHLRYTYDSIRDQIKIGAGTNNARWLEVTLESGRLLGVIDTFRIDEVNWVQLKRL